MEETKTPLQQQLEQLKDLMERYQENLKGMDDYRIKLAASIVDYQRKHQDMLGLLLTYLCETASNLTTHQVPEVHEDMEKQELDKAAQTFQTVSRNADVINQFVQDLVERMSSLIQADKEADNA